MRKAKIMHDEKCGRSGAVSDFNASRGWLEKFMSRNGLSLRRKTTQAQQDPTKLIDKLIAYILKIRRLRGKHGYRDSDIIAMDETPVWQDMLSIQQLTRQATKKLESPFVSLQKPMEQS